MNKLIPPENGFPSRWQSYINDLEVAREGTPSPNLLEQALQAGVKKLVLTSTGGVIGAWLLEAGLPVFGSIGLTLVAATAVLMGVQAGLGLGVVPHGAIEIELQLGKLVELKVKGLPIWRKWYVVLHKAKRLSVAAEEFRSLLINEAVDLLQD